MRTHQRSKSNCNNCKLGELELLQYWLELPIVKTIDFQRTRGAPFDSLLKIGAEGITLILKEKNYSTYDAVATWELEERKDHLLLGILCKARDANTPSRIKHP